MDDQDDSFHYGEKSSGASSFALFVPLYLVILAFFILLNSISDEHKYKTDVAIMSIEESFSTGTGIAKIQNKSLFFDFSNIVTTYFDELEKELKSSFETEKINIERKGYKMRIKIPLHKVFEKNSSKLLNVRKELLDKLAKIITLERQGVVIKINLTIDSQNFVSLSKQDAFKVDKERTVSVVNKFTSYGLPKNNITAGITFNDETNIVILTEVEKEEGFFEELIGN